MCGQGCPRSEIFAIALLLLSPFFIYAQTADDYFHGGATNYVFGQREKAKEEVTSGLQHFPSDPKLKSLLALLKKEDEQKQQQQQQQDQKNDQNKDQQKNQDSQKQNSDQKKDEQQKQQANEQKKQDEKKKQDQAKNKSDQKKDEQEKRASEKKKQDKSDQNPEGEPQQAVAAGQMTPEQAKQLLDAQKGDEMIIPVRPQVKPRDMSKPLKDW